MGIQERLETTEAVDVAAASAPGALATLDEDTRAGVVLALQRTSGNQVVTRMLSAPEGVYRGKGKVAKGIIGWIVTVGERKLVKRAAIYTEKEMSKLLSKGYNILVRDGEHVAKRVARKVWEDYIHHTGHLIRKTGSTASRTTSRCARSSAVPARRAGTSSTRLCRCSSSPRTPRQWRSMRTSTPAPRRRGT